MDHFGDNIEQMLDTSACACTRCGYDLRGTIAASHRRCPECDKEVKLSVAPEQRGQAAWLLMVIAAAFLLGGSSLYLAYVYIRDLDQWAGSVEVGAMWLAVPMSLALLVWLSVNRELITRRSRFAIRLAATSITLVIALFLLWWVGISLVL